MAEKYILVLESSTDKTTVALGADGKFLSQEEVVSNRYSEKIIYLIDDVLRNNGLSVNELYGFGIGLGPGSFTGTRAGISTIRALGQALRKPVAGVSSMDAVAYVLVDSGSFAGDREIFIALDARRGEVYGCAYQYINGELFQKDPKLMSIEEFEKFAEQSTDTVFSGSALGLIKISGERFAGEDLWHPQAQHLIKPVFQSIGDKTWREIFDLVPIYWRSADAKPMTQQARP